MQKNGRWRSLRELQWQPMNPRADTPATALNAGRLAEDQAEQQLRRACAELDRNLRAGQPAQAEQWLDELPAVAADADLALELVYTEYLTRESLGQSPPPQELFERFPGLADRLRALLEVDALLQEEQDTAQAPDPLATSTPSAATSPLGGQARFGAYEILETLGHGGMGVVYKARHVQLQRTVALKMTLAGPAAGEAELSRLRREAQAFAQLHHPNIVQIFEVGEHDGRPFLALEYVAGGNLHQALDGKACSAAVAAQLVGSLAEAIEYAHQRGILHRDLKPANVLLGAGVRDRDSGVRSQESAVRRRRLEDKQPSLSPGSCSLTPDSCLLTPDSWTAKITDFGLARDLQSDQSLTRTGNAFGTPCYVPPEQAEARPGWSTRLVDVYALGAILYEMLTGRPPFLGFSYAETLRQVVQQDPVPPSRLHPGLPGDLETICLKCLEKEPAKRYPSAQALADDLERFRSGRPILARPVSVTEKIIRWARRKPLAASLIAVSALAVLGGLGLTWLFTDQLQAEVARTQRQAEATERERQAAEQQRTIAETNQLKAEGEEAKAKHHLDQVQRALANAQLLRVGAISGTHPEQGLKWLLNEEWFPPRLRDFAWRYQHRLCSERVRTLSGHDRFITAVAWSPKGDVVASADRDGGLKLWDAHPGGAGDRSTRITPERWTARAGRPVRALAFDPQGKWLAAGCFDSTVQVWQVADGQLLTTIDTEVVDIRAVMWSPDSRRLYIAGGSVTSSDAAPGVIKVCAPLSPGQAVETFARHPSPIRGAALTSDGQRLFVAGGQRLPLTGEKCRVRLWDVGKRTLLGEREAPCVVTAFALGPDDDLLAVGGGHGQLCLWRWSEPSPRPIHGCEGTLNAIAFAHDGQRIAAVAGENIVRVWDVTTGTPHLALDGHKSGISSVAFAPDAERLATGSNDQTVKLWNLNLGAEGLPANPHAGAVAGLAISGDGKTLVTAAMDRSIKIWELPERAKLQAPSRHEAGREGTINLRHHVQDVIQYGALAISRDGQTLVHVDRAGRCVVRSARTGEVERYLPDLKLPPYALVMSPDGNTLAVSGKSAAIRILDPQTGAVRALLQGHTGTYVNHLHFKSDRELASADSKDVILWDLSTGKPRRTLSGAGSVSRLAFAPDGSRLAIGRSDGAILLWSPEKEGTASLLLGHEKFVAALAWTADSRSLASGSIDGVRLWDPIMMQELAVLRDPRGPVFALLFTPDDRTLISAGGRLAPEGYVRFWHASP